MSRIKIESGIQLLNRIKNPNCNVWNLEDKLFTEGLKANDIVAVMADSVYLKNMLLMHLLKQTILVDSFKNLSVGAHNRGVLFIDTAFQFNLDHFANYLRRCVDTDRTSLNVSDREVIVEKSLENLLYVPCYDSHQLSVTFYGLRSTISSNSNIRLLVLDNVGANYWQDLLNGGKRKMNYYEKNIIVTMQNYIKNFELPLLYVRPESFISKYPAACELCSYQIDAKKSEKNKFYYKVEAKSKLQKIEKIFITSGAGLKWI